MNAYELADELQELITAPTPVDDADACKLIDETAIMLRQQADRIAELEKEVNHMQSFYGCDPAYYGMKQSKPVGWYKEKSNDYFIDNIGQPDFQVEEFIEAGYIPLYTHPVKQLSDDEIVDILDGIVGNVQYIEVLHMIIFAKAIIKEITE